MPSLHHTVNTFHLGYKNQSVYGVRCTSRCLFWDKYKTHKYSVGREHDYWLLNTLLHYITSRLLRCINPQLTNVVYIYMQLLVKPEILTSYIYIYIWTYVWQRWKPSFSIFCIMFQNWFNAESYPVSQLYVNTLLITDGIQFGTLRVNITPQNE
jgi:hypothetical protein